MLRLSGLGALAVNAHVVRSHLARSGERMIGVEFLGVDADVEDMIHDIVLSHLEGSYGQYGRADVVG